VRSIDGDVPATLSRALMTDLLRGELGFRGVLVSDDLEMRAVADRYPIETSSVQASAAGCDLLLVCSDEDLADEAHAALVREIESSPAFASRCEEAARRNAALRARAAALHAERDASAPTIAAIADEIAARSPGAGA